MDAEWLIVTYAQMLKDELNGLPGVDREVVLPATAPSGSSVMWYYEAVTMDIILDSSYQDTTPADGFDDDSTLSFRSTSPDESIFSATVTYGGATEVVYFGVTQTGGVFEVVAGYVI